MCVGRKEAKRKEAKRRAYEESDCRQEVGSDGGICGKGEGKGRGGGSVVRTDTE